MDGSPPGSPVPGILQARTLEWVAISFSDAWKWKVKVKSLSRVQLFATPWTADYQAPLSMGFSRKEYWSGVPLPSLSGPITSWQIDWETVETVRDFTFLGSKISADGDCSHEIKRLLLLGRKAVTNLDRILFLLLLSSILLLPLLGLFQTISWRAVLVIMDSFSFCLSGNIFILLSLLNSWSIYCILSWKCLFFLLALWIYQTLLSGFQSFWWEICWRSYWGYLKLTHPVSGKLCAGLFRNMGTATWQQV